MSASWPATLFDGRSGAGESVAVTLEGTTLAIASARGMEAIPLARVEVRESFAHAPRMLGLPGGATLEISDSRQSFTAALEGAGHRAGVVERMQRAWPAVLAALVAIVTLAGWSYFVGVPRAADAIARSIPRDIERAIGEGSLSVLDQQSLRPSALPPARRDRLAARFRETAARAAPGVPVEVEFRAGAANAFALPGGIVVIFDGLVELAEDDEAVVGVFGHELGHVVHRHGLRQLLQAAGIGMMAGVVWGDVSGLIAQAPTLLGVMRYGRGFESEADAYALEFLRANELSPRPLYDLMRRLDSPAAVRAEVAAGAQKGRERGAQNGGEPSTPARLPDFLSTHPSNARRLEALREAADAYDARRRPGS